MSFLHGMIPGSTEVSPVPTWICDASSCPERTPVLSDPTGASQGRPWRPVDPDWWEHQGTHLCPTHNPDSEN